MNNQRLSVIRRLNAVLRSDDVPDDVDLLIKLRDSLVYEQGRPLTGPSLAFLSALQLINACGETDSRANHSRLVRSLRQASSLIINPNATDREDLID